MHISVKTITEKFIIMLLFLISFDFLGLGSKLQIPLLAMAFIYMALKKKYTISLQGFLIIAYAVSYSYFAVFNDFISITFLSTHIVSVVLMFILGNLLEDNKGSDKRIVILIVASLLGYALQAMYSLTYSILNNLSNRISIIGLWGKGIHTAIQQGMYMVLPEAVGIYLLFVEKGFGKKLFGIFLAAISIENAMFFASRSAIAVMAICALALLTYILSGKNKSYKKRALSILAISALVILLGYHLNFLGIKDLWLDSNMYYRLFISKSGLDSEPRFVLWARGIVTAIQNPFGVGNKGTAYAHNLWIDVMLEAGFLTGILLLAANIWGVLKLFRFIKTTDISFNIRAFVFAVYVSTLTAVSVEPAMQGVPLLTSNLFFIDGIIESRLRRVGNQLNN